MTTKEIIDDMRANARRIEQGLLDVNVISDALRMRIFRELSQLLVRASDLPDDVEIPDVVESIARSAKIVLRVNDQAGGK